MFNKHRKAQFETYQNARRLLINDPSLLIELEKFITDSVVQLLGENTNEIIDDYNEASHLYPFWQQYPPDERGRQPKGDQFPWIEVGEHVLGRKFARWLPSRFRVEDTGTPTGPDERFVLSGTQIENILGFSDACWLFLDIKSAGPRDNFDHAVMSHNQVSGSGIWEHPDDGVRNDPIIARGKRAKHLFHCAIPPIYVLSDGRALPVVHVVLKPVYAMLSGDDGLGQPLDSISIATIPNGLLLTQSPNYLKAHPELFYPGKDDKTKNPLKVRARISFEILRSIGAWRFHEITLD